jgi:phthalate 4,5-dioxygenase
MGEREKAPPLPAIEAALLPESELQIMFAQRECNWLQALEGDIDTSHFGFLHAGGVDPAELPADNLIRYTVSNRAPEYHVADMPWGTMYAAYRAAEAGQTYWRFASFLFPFWTLIPQGPFDRVHARAWLPLDDTHTMFVSLQWKNLPQELAMRSNSRLIPGSLTPPRYLPNSTDWFGRWRLAGNAGNDWLIDRELQKNGGVYTGIAGIPAQDQAVTESMGGVTDHAFEHLGPGDLMITRTRRRLLKAARALARDGTVPPAVDDPEICAEVRTGDFLADARIGWREAYALQMRTALRPLKQAAE